MLTNEQIDAMEAGREMDADVADWVMGWTVCACGHGETYGGCGLNFPPGSNDEQEIPHYSTDIAAAWLVVEKLSVRFRRVEIHCAEGGYSAMLADGESEIDEHYPFISEGETAPLAICRAALKAALINQIGENQNERTN